MDRQNVIRRERAELDPKNNTKGFFINREPHEVALRVGLLGAAAAGGLYAGGHLLARLGRNEGKKLATMGSVSAPAPKPSRPLLSPQEINKAKQKAKEKVREVKKSKAIGSVKQVKKDLANPNKVWGEDW